jgi:glycosyltransferase involved in cell wall biosynthesis
LTIHVLHVIDSLKPGGAEQQLVNLVRTHDRHRVRSSVVTLFEESDLAPEIEAAGIHVERLGLTGPGQSLRGVHRLRRYIGDTRPDLVHTRLVFADLIGRVAGAVSGIPVVSSVEAPVYDPNARTDDPKFRRWKVELVRLADGLTGRLARVTYVPCSQDVARSTARALLLPSGRVRVIHNSTVIPNGTGSRRRAESLSADDDVRILTVGRLSPQKGQTYLLRALVRVVERYPRATLTVVGRGPLEAALRLEARSLGLDDRVRFVGKRPDVPDLLADAHLFVLPSLWEGLSIVALEAMALGVAIVASDISSMREIAVDGEHAVLVPPRNVDALAQSIVAALDDRALRQRIAKGARERARSLFDVRVAARRFEQLYEDVARGVHT